MDTPPALLISAGPKTNLCKKDSSILNAVHEFIIFPGKNSNFEQQKCVELSVSVHKMTKVGCFEKKNY